MDEKVSQDSPFELGDFLDWASDYGLKIPDHSDSEPWKRLLKHLVRFNGDPVADQVRLDFVDKQRWVIFEDENYMLTRPDYLVWDRTQNPQTLTGGVELTVSGRKRQGNFQPSKNTDIYVKKARADEMTLAETNDAVVPVAPGLNAAPSSLYPCTLCKAKDMTLSDLIDKKTASQIDSFITISYGATPTVTVNVTLGGQAENNTTVHSFFAQFDGKTSQYAIPNTHCNYVNGAPVCIPLPTNQSTSRIEQKQDKYLCPDPTRKPDPPDILEFLKWLILGGFLLKLPELLAWLRTIYGASRSSQTSNQTEMIDLSYNALKESGKKVILKDAFEGGFESFKSSEYTPSSYNLCEAISKSKLGPEMNKSLEALMEILSSDVMKYSMGAVAGATFIYITSVPAEKPERISKKLVEINHLQPNKQDASKLVLALKDGLLHKDKSAFKTQDFAAFLMKGLPELDVNSAAAAIKAVAGATPPDPSFNAQALIKILKSLFESLDMVAVAGAVYGVFPDITADEFAQSLYNVYGDAENTDQYVQTFKNTQTFDACDAYQSLLKVGLDQASLARSIQKIYQTEGYYLVLKDGSVQIPSVDAYDLKGAYTLYFELEANENHTGILFLRYSDTDDINRGLFVHLHADSGKIDIVNADISGSVSVSVSSSNILDGGRHELLFIRQKNSDGQAVFRIFIDGTEQKLAGGDSGRFVDLTTDSPLNIGGPPKRAEYVPDGSYHGKVYNVKYWNTAKVPDDLTDEGLIGWWNFHDGHYKDRSPTQNKDGVPVPDDGQQVQLIFDPCSPTTHLPRDNE